MPSVQSACSARRAQESRAPQEQTHCEGTRDESKDHDASRRLLGLGACSLSPDQHQTQYCPNSSPHHEKRNTHHDQWVADLVDRALTSPRQENQQTDQDESHSESDHCAQPGPSSHGIEYWVRNRDGTRKAAGSSAGPRTSRHERTHASYSGT